LFITVLHKKHPKSFVSNFWGAVQIETDSLYIFPIIQINTLPIDQVTC
jgi:hypothetical protein